MIIKYYKQFVMSQQLRNENVFDTIHQLRNNFLTFLLDRPSTVDAKELGED